MILLLSARDFFYYLQHKVLILNVLFSLTTASSYLLFATKVSIILQKIHDDQFGAFVLNDTFAKNADQYLLFLFSSQHPSACLS